MRLIDADVIIKALDEALEDARTDTSNSTPDLPGLDEQMADPSYDEFMMELMQHNRDCIIDGFEFEDIGDFI